MLCTFRKLTHYSAVVQTVGCSISQIRNRGSTYVVYVIPVCYRQCLLCHCMLVLRQGLLEETLRVMSLYASLFTGAVIKLCRSYNTGCKVPQPRIYITYQHKEKNSKQRQLQLNHIMLVSFETAYVDLIPSPCNRVSMSFRIQLESHTVINTHHEGLQMDLFYVLFKYTSKL